MRGKLCPKLHMLQRKSCLLWSFKAQLPKGKEIFKMVSNQYGLRIQTFRMDADLSNWCWLSPQEQAGWNCGSSVAVRLNSG